MSQVLLPENIRFLVVHCSDTPDAEPCTASDIHRMHLGFGWHGVGYHRVINREGGIEMGRPDYWQGAHVYGFNDVSLGVCLIGRSSFASSQFDSLEKVLEQWRLTCPEATICGHRDFSYTDKTCPNFDVSSWCRARGIDPYDQGRLPVIA